MTERIGRDSAAQRQAFVQQFRRPRIFGGGASGLAFSGLVALLWNCSSDPESTLPALGVSGATAIAGATSGGSGGGSSGGTTPKGGSTNSGGKAATSGGTTSDGGDPGSGPTGGNDSPPDDPQGGDSGTSTGGRSATGGSSSGGGSTGGRAATGGSSNTGGSPVEPNPSPSGFTDFEPSDDTRTIYVSSSDGDDANDGLTEDAPVATAAKGVSLLRNNFPDHLLFKRGDVWQSGLGQWKLSGRSPDEPMVVGSYGDGERPRFEFNGNAVFTNGGGGAPPSNDNLAFVGLHFLATAHDISRGPPSGNTSLCVFFLRPSNDVLWEDNRFEYCQVTAQAETKGTIQRWRFNRNLFLNSYSLNAEANEHAQGIYLSGVVSFIVEESIFDLCGWHPDVPAATPTIFNHCVYWQSDAAPDGILRNNVIMRASSHGAQMRSSGRVEGNVFVRNGIAGFLAGDYNAAPDGVQGTVIGNVFSESQDITPREGHEAGEERRGWGFDLLAKDGFGNITYSDNIYNKCSGSGQCQTGPAAFPDSRIEDNVVWDWDSNRGGDLQLSAGPFPDPERTVASYNGSLGGDDTFEAFAEQLRQQSRTNWREEYTAEAIVEYFREGVGK